ncbi:MAG: hypothetical protein OXC48_10960, partial [Endozoicomonadaceae bacterium]|nr:hypothetical protein [Endozoicomonadaceae bacterium]
DSEAQVGPEYEAIMGDTQIYSGLLTNAMAEGNGVFLIDRGYVPIRIYVVRSLRGNWSAVAPAGTMQNPAQLNVLKNVDLVELYENAHVNPFEVNPMIFK